MRLSLAPVSRERGNDAVASIAKTAGDPKVPAST